MAERWIIEFTGADPSEDSTVSYESREEAVAAAADFAKSMAEDELETFEDMDDEMREILEEVVAAEEAGAHDDAVHGWLEYQQEADPDEQIAIGPSGRVSPSPWDFAT